MRRTGEQVAKIQRVLPPLLCWAPKRTLPEEGRVSDGVISVFVGATLLGREHDAASSISSSRQIDNSG